MVSGITPCARECKWIVYFGETPYAGFGRSYKQDAEIFLTSASASHQLCSLP
jgi:hypothetical protein